MDAHCEAIMEQYRAEKPIFETMRGVVLGSLRDSITSSGLVVDAVDGRVKEEQSLAGKLELKGQKYRSLDDITDILGARVVTFYSDDVDKVATIVEQHFLVDWENSVDKRALLDPDRFGYLSLHYVCRIPETLYRDPDHPELNDIRFEIQLRSALQHAWASIYHDTGYKGSVPLPRELLRELNRLAGLLEIADDEFVRARKQVDDYHEEVRRSLANRAKLDEISLNEASYAEWVAGRPFDPLVNRIASINGAEIAHTNPMAWLETFLWLGKRTLGELELMVERCSGLAYEISHRQMQGTDLDIFSSVIAVRNLCVADLYLSGEDAERVAGLLGVLQGPRPRDLHQAERLLALCREIDPEGEGRYTA